MRLSDREVLEAVRALPPNHDLITEGTVEPGDRRWNVDAKMWLPVGKMSFGKPISENDAVIRQKSDNTIQAEESNTPGWGEW